MLRLPSYHPSSCCGADCPHESETEPCWGEVEVLGEESYGDGDYYWVHACQGHREYYDGDGKYRPEVQATPPNA